MANLFFRVDQGNSVNPVVRVDEVFEKTVNDKEQEDKIKQRAKELSLSGDSDSRLIEKAVEWQIKQDNAKMEALRGKWYRFIQMVAGFSNEKISNFFKDDTGGKNPSDPLTNTPSIGSMAQINAAVSGEGGSANEKELGEYLKTRQYLFASAEVRGYIFLQPVAYSHISEAVELLNNMCSTKIDVDELVGSKHSTYLARLVSTRIQITRFLSGRYYSLSANFNRLRTQQHYLIQYFKTHLGSTSRAIGQGGGSATNKLFADLEGM